MSAPDQKQKRAIVLMLDGHDIRKIRIAIRSLAWGNNPDMDGLWLLSERLQAAYDSPPPVAVGLLLASDKAVPK